MSEVNIVVVGWLSGIVGVAVGFGACCVLMALAGRQPKPAPKTRAEHVRAWVEKTEGRRGLFDEDLRLLKVEEREGRYQ